MLKDSAASMQLADGTPPPSAAAAAVGKCSAKGVRAKSALDAVLRGDLANIPALPANQVKLYVCSTQSDMEYERRRLWEEVLPDLQLCFVQHGLDIQLVDMHQGCGVDHAHDRHTFDAHMRHIDTCHADSLAAFFICLVGNMYGPVPLPAYIEECEFAHIKSEVFEAGKDLKLLAEWYVKEDNVHPPVYALQPISRCFKHYNDRRPDKVELHKQDVERWLEVFHQLQETLTYAARVCHKEGKINQVHDYKQQRYFKSAVEQQTCRAMELSKKKCLIVHRIFEGVHAEDKGARKFTDLDKKSQKWDKEAKNKLKDFRNSIAATLNKDNIKSFRIKWRENGLDPYHSEEHVQYLEEFSESVFDFTKTAIQQYVKKREEAWKDDASCNGRKDFYTEITTHLHHCKHLASVKTHGFDEVEDQVREHLKCASGNRHQMSVVLGPDGSGKSTFISRIAQIARQALGEQAVVVVWFVGMTPMTQTVNDLLYMLCMQLKLVLGISEFDPDVHHGQEKLVECYQSLLDLLSHCVQPVVILLDGIDHLKSMTPNTEPNLDWLTFSLPENVHMYSSLTTTAQFRVLFDQLKSRLPAEYLIPLPALSDASIEAVVADHFSSQRRLTEQQRTTLCNVLRLSPRPLYVTLMLEAASRWSSSYVPSGTHLPDTVEELVTDRLKHLEKQHGVGVVSHVVRYLSSALWGLSEMELLDVLSCNNTILLQTLKGDSSLTTLRFPYALWTTIRQALGCFLCEWRMDQKTLICWRHQVVRSVASHRYWGKLDDMKLAHKDLGDLFMGTWVGNKPLMRPDQGIQIIDEGSRYVCHQPLLYSDSSYNYRRIRELWYQLLQAGDFANFKENCFCNFEYLLAMMHGTSVHHLITDLEITCSRVLDAEVNLVLMCLKKAKFILTSDPLQLANELIGRLRQVKDLYPRHVEPLVQQAMEWCDSYSLPILVPLSSWLPDPRVALVTMLECSEGVTNICPTASGQHIFCATPQHEIKMYHISSKKHFRTLSGHRGSITCLLLAHSKPFLLSGSMDTTLRMWDINTGKCMNMFREHNDGILCIALKKTDDVVATGSKDNTFKIITLDSGNVTYVCQQHTDAITSLSFSSKDMLLISASTDKTVKVWSMEDMELMNTIEEEISSPITCMAVSRDNIFIVLGCEDTSAHVKSLCTGSHIQQLTGHKGQVMSVVVSDDSLHCVLGCSDGVVYVYNLRTTELLDCFNTKRHCVSSVQLSADGYFIFSAAKEMVHVWTLFQQHAQALRTEEHTAPITCIAISKDGKMAISGSQDHLVKLWNLDISDFSASLEGHEGTVTSVALATDDPYAVTGSEDQTVKVWSIISGSIITDYREHCSAVKSVSILNDGHRILSAEVNAVMKLWLAEDGLTLLSIAGPVDLLQLSPNSQLVMSGETNGTSVKIWRVEDGCVVHTVNHSDRITLVEYSSDSQYVVTGSADMSLKVWEAPTGKLTQVLVAHEADVSCAAVTENNRFIISGSHDKQLLVWGLSTGAVEHHMTGHTDHVTCVKVTKDGSIAISGSKDGTLRVWNVNLGLQITHFDMHYPIVDVFVTPNAGHVIVRLASKSSLPLMCLHNSPAGEVKSQSQVNIQMRGDSPYLPLRHKPLIAHPRLTRYALPARRIRPEGRPPSISTIPEIIRVSPIHAPLQKTVKAQEKHKGRRVEARKVGARRDMNKDKQDVKQSTTCVIL